MEVQIRLEGGLTIYGSDSTGVESDIGCVVAPIAAIDRMILRIGI